jgi:RNA polymerase sigma-70 factor (ECF subfamily)
MGGAVSDGVLIAAARSSDLHAWETLVRRHQGFAFLCAYLTTRDPQVAAVAIQEAFVRAYRALPSLESESALRPWLMGIVATVSRSKKRQTAQQRDARYVEPQRFRRVPAEQLAPSVAHATPTPLEQEALLGAFDRLGDADRELVASRYVLGLTRSEIVAYLGISEHDLDARLQAALSRLRTYLAGA